MIDLLKCNERTNVITHFPCTVIFRIQLELSRALFIQLEVIVPTLHIMLYYMVAAFEEIVASRIECRRK